MIKFSFWPKKEAVVRVLDEAMPSVVALFTTSTIFYGLWKHIDWSEKDAYIRFGTPGLLTNYGHTSSPTVDKVETNNGRPEHNCTP